MKTIELTDNEIRMLCTAIRIVLGQINPTAKRFELNAEDEDLSAWALLNMKVSCKECSLDDNHICLVCGGEYTTVTPNTAQGLMNWVVNTGLYNQDGTKVEASELKEFVDCCAKIRDSQDLC